MFVGTQHTKEQKELITRERKGQDATKITSAAGFVGQKNFFHLPIRMLCLCLALMNLLLKCCAPFF